MIKKMWFRLTLLLLLLFAVFALLTFNSLQREKRFDEDEAMKTYLVPLVSEEENYRADFVRLTDIVSTNQSVIHVTVLLIFEDKLFSPQKKLENSEELLRETAENFFSSLNSVELDEILFDTTLRANLAKKLNESLGNEWIDGVFIENLYSTTLQKADSENL